MSRYTILLIIVAWIIGCGSRSETQTTITLATTTSTRDSGLLDELLPIFESQSGYRVKVLAVGSGQALELARRGDADVVLTHAPQGERDLVDEGFAESRIPIMYNDFVLVGPPADPAGVLGEPSIVTALEMIAEQQLPFVSRGDESGTHTKEKSLWAEIQNRSLGDWYLESGSGMAATLRIASEKQAYTLTDRATFLAQESRNSMQIVSEGDPRLRNPYAVLIVNHNKHPHTNHAGANAFADFLRAESTRRLIASFGKERYGAPLFFPLDDLQTEEHH